jgi:pilus assembly protein Flp/PilA
MRDRDRGKEFAVIKFGKIIRNESGASAAEYALILAIIGSVIAVAALGLGNAIGNRMNKASSCINGGTAATCGATT